MSLDACPTTLTKFGKVTIYPPDEQGPRIVFEGFEGDRCSCRDVAVLAGMYAIGVLQRETMLTIQDGGAGSSAVD